jgi:hypothetical protein
MYCYQCGIQLSDDAKFCSGCGRTMDLPQAAGAPKRNMATHVNILAWLFIGNAVLTGMGAFALLIAPKILQMLPMPVPPEAPFDVVAFVTAVSGFLGTLLIIVAAASAAAGVGLLRYETWGRTLALVMAAVMMLKIPFGTAIGIYAFWVLLSEHGREFYERKAAIAEGRA